MPSALAVSLRTQIEAALASRIPAALTPQPRLLSPVEPVNIAEIDALLQGGLPSGAISEIAGPESSGRTSLALAFLAGMTQTGKVCAWVDASDAFDPESAEAAGVDLARLLWVRCGATNPSVRKAAPSAHKLWSRLDQALRCADLLLETGGFGAIILDMGDILPEHASRTPLATWFRFRAAAERAQLNFLLLTRIPCAKSSAGVTLHMAPGDPESSSALLTGMEYRSRLAARRFPASSEGSSSRKPPQSTHGAAWRSAASWIGIR